MKSLYNAILYKPLFNLLVILIAFIPGNNLGVAVIVLTLLIKFILSPFSYKALVSQVKNKKIQPLIDKIKKDHPDDKKLQSQKQLEIYQKMKVNPFSGCIPTIVQIVVVLALYSLLREGFAVDASLLYPFVSSPESFSVSFLGLTDVNTPSVVLAFVAGFFQYIQVWLSPAFKKDKKKENEDPTDGPVGPMDMMQKQMGIFVKFIMPGMVIFFGFMFPAALVLYWITNTVFTIGQELIIKGRLKAIEEDIEFRLKELSL
ncbi:MAG: YidC/Oxa1 family membrane protein insertase [Candidatus Paceibacteria bacterium]|jgi:YidC/Oxa1 family membrane protein insertase